MVVTPLEFHHVLRYPKTRVLVLLHSIVCMTVSLAMLAQHQLVSDRWTDRTSQQIHVAKYHVGKKWTIKTMNYCV